jgi:hypothetical protein
MIINARYICHHVKYLLSLPDFNTTFKFLDRFLKNTQLPNFMKICPARAEFYHADGQVEMTKSLFVIL